jgi:hypothetical protein
VFGRYEFKFQRGNRLSWLIILWFSSVTPDKFLYIRPQQLPSACFPIHHLIIIISFNAIFSELLTASLNKPQNKLIQYWRWLSSGVAMSNRVTWVVIALMMGAASTSETSVNSYQTTRHSNPEDSHLHTRRRENLESHEFNSTSAATTATTNNNLFNTNNNNNINNLSKCWSSWL